MMNGIIPFWFGLGLLWCLGGVVTVLAWEMWGGRNDSVTGGVSVKAMALLLMVMAVLCFIAPWVFRQGVGGR